MTSPAASIRGGAVGVLTVALAVAAHGMADGGYPSGSAAVLLLIVGLGVGAIVAIPSPRSRVRGAFAGLALGQIASHVALAVGVSHEMAHAHSILPSPGMLGFHLAASAVTAALLCAAESLYGPLTSIVRAVLDPPLPLPQRVGALIATGDHDGASFHLLSNSISRRGPPLSV